eukprot:SAG11_NODE_63_length_18904_cov_11.842914_8_plen_81_part_00
MDPGREVVLLVARYCGGIEWLGSGRDGNAWPAQNIVQGIAVAFPELYFEELRDLQCLVTHRFLFRLGEFSHLERFPVNVH